MRLILKNLLNKIEKITKGRFNSQMAKIKLKKISHRYKMEIIFLFFMDVILFPLTLISSLILKFIRSLGVRYLVLSKWIFNRLGVYPILDHYYEPLFNERHLHTALEKKRELQSIDFNDKEQLLLLSKFDYNEELLQFPLKKESPLQFAYDDGSFPRGDSEYYYSMIREFKPHRIIEIGSGQSTLMAYNAILKNSQDDESYNCEFTCIEPYEQKWLEKLKHVKIIRNKVENIDLTLFKNLRKNDILFIDSSHIIPGLLSSK